MIPTTTPDYIITGKDGCLDNVSKHDIDTIISNIAKSKKVVLHFHGGLVSLENGKACVRRMKERCYDSSGAYSVFFVWQSGLMETLRHDWEKITKEILFKRLLAWTMKFLVAKAEQPNTSKGLVLRLPDEILHHEEMKTPDPYSQLAHSRLRERNLTLTATEEDQLRKAIQNDSDLGNMLVPKPILGHTPKSFVAIGATAALAKVAHSAVIILKRILDRFNKGRDHGAYPTIVEEIFRELYFSRMGSAVWNAMKEKTSATFNQAEDPAIGGGHYFLTKFAELLGNGHCPEVSLVGHSTGAIFINNLLGSFLRRRAIENWVSDFKFKRVVFLAPACRFDDFDITISRYLSLFDDFRMFAMDDLRERRDVLIEHIYPRSLLYAISGILETQVQQGTDVSAYDLPILGMQRYLFEEAIYPEDRFPEIARCRSFLKVPGRVVWAISTGADTGLNSTCEHHGDFDKDIDTLESIAAFLKT